MRRIEKAIKDERENILKRYCPSDYGLNEYRECAFKRNKGWGLEIDEEECFECWNEEIEEA